MISKFGNHPSTVLLVIVNESVRNTLYQDLVRDGYHVATAADAREAMRFLQMPTLSIGVVVLDVDLPDVSGLNLSTRMREVLPAPPHMICMGVAEPKDILALLQHAHVRRWYPQASVKEIRADVNEAFLAQGWSKGKALAVSATVRKARTTRAPARRQLRLPLRRRLKARPSKN